MPTPTDRQEPRGAVPAYVINLEDAVERREEALAQLAQVGAIEPVILRATDYRAPDFSSSVAQRYADHVQELTSLDAGIIACFHSHFRAWTQIAKRDDLGAFVFEDDIMVHGDFSRFLEAIDFDFDYIFVNMRASRHLQFRDWDAAFASVDEVYRYNRTEFPKESLPIGVGGSLPTMGGDGYFMSPRGARKLIEIVEAEGIRNHVDFFLQTAGTTPETLRGVVAPGIIKRIMGRYDVEKFGLEAFISSQPLVNIGPLGNAKRSRPR